MKKFEFIWNEFVYGGHWFSISASSIAFSTMILLDVKIKWEFLLIVYLLIQCIFNYNHFKEIKIDALYNSERTNHLNIYHKYLPLLTFIYGVGFLAMLFYFGNYFSLIFGGLLLLLGLLFTTLFKKITSKIIGFKTFYAAFSLSLLIIFTAFYCSYSINLILFNLFVLFSLRFMVSSSFSDIKDINIDKKRNLITLPIYFGRRRFLSFLHILNFITFIILFMTILQITPKFSIFLIFSYIYTFYYLEKAKNTNVDIKSLTNIIADGEFIFWPFLLYMGLILTP
ncbi:MAG: UbiA family prenyltransferase [Thermoplasmatales archaeon]|nr:UbiA family prenyltransferase [Thermoplasmatales archaeon]